MHSKGQRSEPGFSDCGHSVVDPKEHCPHSESEPGRSSTVVQCSTVAILLLCVYIYIQNQTRVVVVVVVFIFL